MSNQLNVIAPYVLEDVNTWVFDDSRVGLVQEPFVSGADVFLSFLSKDIPDAHKGFRLVFSPIRFPVINERSPTRKTKWAAVVDRPAHSWLAVSRSTAIL